MSHRKEHSGDLRRRAKKHKEQLAATTGLATGLRLAERLLEDGRLPEAHQQLHELDREYPQRREVLRLLAEVCRQLNVAEYRQVCQRLVDLDPADCEAVLSLANAYLQNDHRTLALVAYRRFLERWPRDSRVARLQEPVRMLERQLEVERLNAKLAREDCLEIFTYHEQIQIALSDQEFEHAVELADRILARYPHFDAAGNNRAEALFQLGRLDDAITECRRVLGYKPEDGPAATSAADVPLPAAVGAGAARTRRLRGSRHRPLDCLHQ
ncbi:MAG: tetratricopeptide repeat protein [Planctomycetota bacterium]|nr:tetratricopeptide repeat protein [Planctomycetota bacterium]